MAILPRGPPNRDGYYVESPNAPVPYNQQVSSTCCTFPLSAHNRFYVLQHITSTRK